MAINGLTMRRLSIAFGSALAAIAVTQSGAIAQNLGPPSLRVCNDSSVTIYYSHSWLSSRSWIINDSYVEVLTGECHSGPTSPNDQIYLRIWNDQGGLTTREDVNRCYQTERPLRSNIAETKQECLDYGWEWDGHQQFDLDERNRLWLRIID